MFFKFCGSKLNDSAKFCNVCGKNVGDIEIVEKNPNNSNKLNYDKSSNKNIIFAGILLSIVGIFILSFFMYLKFTNLKSPVANNSSVASSSVVDTKSTTENSNKNSSSNVNDNLDNTNKRNYIDNNVKNNTTESNNTESNITTNRKDKDDLSNIDLTKSEIYTNPRFGFSITYPSILKNKIESTNGDGVTLKNEALNTVVSVWGMNNINNKTVKDLYNEKINSIQNISYKVVDSNWFVISYENNEIIYYCKTVVGSRAINSFVIQYPKKHEKIFDHIVEKLYNSFMTPYIN